MKVELRSSKSRATFSNRGVEFLCLRETYQELESEICIYTNILILMIMFLRASYTSHFRASGIVQLETSYVWISIVQSLCSPNFTQAI